MEISRNSDLLRERGGEGGGTLGRDGVMLRSVVAIRSA